MKEFGMGPRKTWAEVRSKLREKAPEGGHFGLCSTLMHDARARSFAATKTWVEGDEIIKEALAAIDQIEATGVSPEQYWNAYWEPKPAATEIRATTEELTARLREAHGAIRRFGDRRAVHRASGLQYRIIDLALEEKSCSVVVIYSPRFADRLMWTRPLAEFLEKFESNEERLGRLEVGAS